MQLITDIVNDLANNEQPLVTALLKTKVLASRIKNTELLKWINNELNGYEKQDEVPEYRRFNAAIKSDYIKGGYLAKNVPLDLSFLGDEMQSMIETAVLTDGIEALENLKKEYGGNGMLGTSLSSNIVHSLQDMLQKHNPWLQLLSVKQEFSPTSLSHIISSVRSKLLDFMLEMESRFDHIVEFKDLSKNNNQITTILNQTIMSNTSIHNSGDGNIINTGENAKIDAKITIHKGSKDALREKLLEHNVSPDDVTELIEIIDVEPPDLAKKTFGKDVNNWVTKMVGKALEGTWQIGVGAAGGVLVEIIKAYYGMH